MMKNKKVRNTSIVLAATLGLFLFAAKDVLKTGEDNSGKMRIPASHMFGDLRSATTLVEKRYAALLAEPLKKRAPASIGHPASPIENLRFGILEGKYALTMDGETIQDLSFVDTPDSEGRHVAVGSRYEFFNKFAALFGLTGSPEKISIDVKDDRIVEVYRAPSKKGTDILVRVTLDNADRLVGIHTEPLADRKIF